VFSKSKSGLVNATSVGFLPVASEPIGNTGGRRFTKSELAEFSFVSVPANAGALILERQLRGRAMPVRSEQERRWY
jgi:Escherichia/Staphylococcus phage prohead protease